MGTTPMEMIPRVAIPKATRLGELPQLLARKAGLNHKENKYNSDVEVNLSMSTDFIKILKPNDEMYELRINMTIARAAHAKFFTTQGSLKIFLTIQQNAC